MAKQSRNILKSYFETGKRPTEGNYIDLIDTHIILDGENTGSLNLLGNVLLNGSINTLNITSSGNISSSGNLIVNDIDLNGTVGLLSQTNQSGIETLIVYHNGCVGSVAGGIFDTTEASVTYEDEYFQVVVPSSVYEGGEACVTGVTDTADSGDAGFAISEGETQILGFSFTGATIPAGTGTLLVLEGETISFDIDCLNSFIISFF